ncbi:hypothetical protein BGZ83_010626, partial [Gryganskiella cystojenkinii]
PTINHFPLYQIPIQALPYIPPPNNFPPDKWGNQVPDFSQVGYRRGHVPLPQVPVAITLQPSVDPRINDRARIQNALDYVGGLPLKTLTLRDGVTVIKTRGAVLLQAGIYRVQGSLILKKSGVVLRGEGNGPDGTVLTATGQFKHDFIVMNGVLDSNFQGSPEYLQWYGGSNVVKPKDPYVVQDEEVTPVTDQYIPVGTTRLPVKDVSPFEVGDDIVVERQAKQAWVNLIGTNHIKPRPEDPSRTMNWDPRQFTLRYIRKIMAIERNRLPASATANSDKDEDEREAIGGEIEIVDKVADEEERKGPLEAKPQAVFRYGATLSPDTITSNLSLETETQESRDDDDDDDEEEEEDDQEQEGAGENKPAWVPGYLTLDIPTVMSLDPVYGPGSVYNFKREVPIPTDVGLENIALWSEHDPLNIEDEKHGWYAVLIDHCENCWVTDVKSWNFVSGIMAAAGSKHVTIQDCEIKDPISLRSEGGRRYMFMLQGQMGLVKRCFSSDARHDFLTGSKTPGPNVFVDSEGIRANNDAGPHDRWSTGTLYDNIRSFQLNVRNRGWFGSGQGWAGAFHVVFNCSAETPVEFQSPPGSTNWVIKYLSAIGPQPVEFAGEEATFLDPDLQDIDKIPRSLYWSQLVARMGGGYEKAGWIEKMVGVEGKNIYPSRLPRRYVTADEIEAAEEALGLGGVTAGGKVGEEDKKFEEDEDEEGYDEEEGGYDEGDEDNEDEDQDEVSPSNPLGLDIDQKVRQSTNLFQLANQFVRLEQELGDELARTI